VRVSSDPKARRRLALLCAVAAIALVGGAAFGAAVGGDGTEDTSHSDQQVGIEEATANLTLEQQVGQLLILTFPGHSVPVSVGAAFREGRASGAVLFDGNVGDAAQLRTLTGQIQAAAGGSALVATDQEGGDVRTIRFAAPQDAQSAQATPAAAGTAARDAARDLRGLGVNVNLAPVADVGSPGAALGGRFYPGGPAQVAAAVRAATREYGRRRVGATPKHFPGFGSAEANTDDRPVTIPDTRTDLDRDLEPFRAAIAEHAPLVMVSHALYPALDRRRIASQSPAVIGGLLRGRLGYEGAVVTDSLEADAVLSRSSLETAAERSIDAGADLLLLTGSGSYSRVRRRLVERARESAAFRRRIGEALVRVVALKRRLGLRPAGARP
jgi:beta-N-acetylhexosaminidase